MQHKVKKSLGQNFLKSILALNKIVEAGEVTKKDIILEIGPGKGALTEKLLECAGRVIAVEKDRELFEFLKIKFKKEIKNKKLLLINDDILKFNITEVIQNVVFKSIAQAGESSIVIRQQANMRGLKNNILYNYKIIANIPYNITGAILKKFLTEKNQPKSMVLMVQNEVAKRIIARDGKESILSISVKAYGEPKIIMKVPARYFSPAPKVDSAIIAIKNISRNFFIENKLDENTFWRIIHTGFAHKRKKISSNLKKYIGPSYVDVVCQGEPLTNLAKSLGNKRAEELTLLDWISLAKIIDLSADEADINKQC